MNLSNLIFGSFNWSNISNKIFNFNNKFAKQDVNKEIKIGWVSTFNTRCGIATYTKHLLSKFPVEVIILAEKKSSLIEEDSQNVKRCWNLVGRFNNSLKKLKKIINKHDLSIIVIQFNYAFFDFKELSDFIYSQINARRLIIIEFHSTIDPINSPKRKLIYLYEALKNCHSLLVHSVDDFNRMKEIGLIDNVSIFPHGILDFEIKKRNTKFKEDNFLISSYGFALPNKGLEILVEAVNLLHISGQKVYMNMFNAEYENPLSKEVIKNVKDKIDSCKLNDYILLDTKYSNDNEVLEKLSKSDLVLYPYQQSSESTSGAVRVGIASGANVVVTPLPIFKDVAPAVNFLPGFGAKEIAFYISEFIKSKNLIEINQTFKEKNEIASKWRESHRYSIIAVRLYNMIMSLYTNFD